MPYYPASEEQFAAASAATWWTVGDARALHRELVKVRIRFQESQVSGAAAIEAFRTNGKTGESMFSKWKRFPAGDVWVTDYDAVMSERMVRMHSILTPGKADATAKDVGAAKGAAAPVDPGVIMMREQGVQDNAQAWAAALNDFGFALRNRDRLYARKSFEGRVHAYWTYLGIPQFVWEYVQLFFLLYLVCFFSYKFKSELEPLFVWFKDGSTEMVQYGTAVLGDRWRWFWRPAETVVVGTVTKLSTFTVTSTTSTVFSTVTTTVAGSVTTK